MNNPKVLVIGGGAAGMMAAISAAELGAQGTILEKNERLGRKVMITGKGRCNLTNKTDLNGLIDATVGNGRFLYSAFSQFMPQDMMAFLEREGLPLKTERGNRVFPVSDKAADVVDCLARKLRSLHVGVRQGTAVALLHAGGAVTGVKTKAGEQIVADRVIICTGGSSYTPTGSTGDGYRLAKQVGHTVMPLRPSLVPLESPVPWCKEMQGLSLRNIKIRLVENQSGACVYTDFGEMLFTHFGVSGPVVLSASAHIRNADPIAYSLEIDLKPALDERQLDDRLLRDFTKYQNRDFHHLFEDLLPRKMIPVFVRRSAIPPERKGNQITREMRQTVVRLMKRFDLPLSGFRPLEEAIVTAGGVSVKEINPKTMESKRISGLYFAGEVIDVDAYTGGFNLQIAWSTGRLAGTCAAQFSAAQFSEVQ